MSPERTLLFSTTADPSITPRIRKACVACNRKKIKCDGAYPCGHCLRLSDAAGDECTYAPSKKRGPPKGSPARGGHRNRKIRLEAEATSGLVKLSTTPRPMSTLSHPHQHHQQQQQQHQRQQQQQPHHPHQVYHPPPPPHTHPSVHSHPHHQHQQQPHQQPPHQQHTHQQPAAAQQAHTTHHRPSLVHEDRLAAAESSDPQQPPPANANTSSSVGDSILLDLADAAAAANPPAHMDLNLMPPPLPDTPASTSRHPPSHTPSVFASSPRVETPRRDSVMQSYATQAGMSSDVIDDLLLVYESFIHPHWPILYVPALPSLRALETQSPLLFDAVLSLSSANSDVHLGKERFLSSVGKSRAAGDSMAQACNILLESVRQRILASVNAREYAPTIEEVQSLVLVALVDLGFGRTSLAYQMSGFACRMAVDQGLNTTTPRPSPPSVRNRRQGREEHERSRTVWSCFIVDKIVSAVAQRAPCLRLVDMDVPQPSVMERDELDLWLAGPGRHLLDPRSVDAMVCMKSHTLSSFNSWCDVMSILELILDHIYRPSTRRARMEGSPIEGYEDAVLHIDAELWKWRRGLPPHLQWSDDDPSAHWNVGQHPLTVRGWYYLCMLLLHRPQVPYLDIDSPSGGNTATGAPSGNSGRDQSPSSRFVNDPMASYRVPKGVDASRLAATAICTIMESYERTFRVRKYSSSWSYLVFQAGTVHAGLAAHTPVNEHVSQSARAESMRRLDQCIRWLDHIARQWTSAGRHIEILSKLAAIGRNAGLLTQAENNPEGQASNQNTLPPFFVGQNPSSSSPRTSISAPPPQFDPTQPGGQPNFNMTGDPNAQLPSLTPALDLNGWMMLWASMPSAGDDIQLWQQCFPDLS